MPSRWRKRARPQDGLTGDWWTPGLSRVVWVRLPDTRCDTEPCRKTLDAGMYQLTGGSTVFGRGTKAEWGARAIAPRFSLLRVDLIGRGHLAERRSRAEVVVFSVLCLVKELSIFKIQ